MRRLVLLILLVIFPVIASANDLSGTAWFFDEDDGVKTLMLFENDLTFSYLNVVSRFNQGEVFHEDIDTYTVTGDRVVVSFTDGYRICSLTLNSAGNRMSGTCINKKGEVNEITARLIE